MGGGGWGAVGGRGGGGGLRGVGVERWAVRGREGGVHKAKGAPSNTRGTVTVPEDGCVGGRGYSLCSGGDMRGEGKM